jgi:hypothetical protein
MSIEQVSGFEIVETEDGWNSFETSAKTGAEIWARLANITYRHDARFRYNLRPRGLASLVLIREWADLVVSHAQVVEGDNAPVAVLEEGESSITLGWNGTWTSGRQVRVEIFPAEYPNEGTAYVRYHTGTGKPSTFLYDIFTSEKSAAEDVIIPEEMAKQIRGDLAFAFGGYSQFGTEDVIKAVCGHVRNGTLLRREKAVALSVIAAALLQEEERWEGTGPPTPTSEEWLLIHKEGDRVVGECWEAQRSNQGARGYGMPKGVVRAPAIVD